MPLYNIHKTYAGLRDAYLLAGSKEARNMLVKLTDWMMNLTKDLSDEQIQDMLRSEHGGLNEVFADVADLTGKDNYLQLARRFSHREILDPLLEHEDRLTGKHANTQIPKVIGYKRIADLQGDEVGTMRHVSFGRRWWSGAASLSAATVCVSISILRRISPVC